MKYYYLVNFLNPEIKCSKPINVIDGNTYVAFTTKKEAEKFANTKFFNIKTGKHEKATTVIKKVIILDTHKELMELHPIVIKE